MNNHSSLTVLPSVMPITNLKHEMYALNQLQVTSWKVEGQGEIPTLISGD